MGEIFDRFWWLAVLGALVVGIAVALVAIPKPGELGAAQWMVILTPFLAVLLGVVLRTVVPFLQKALEQMRDTGEWPVFEPQYLVPPLAMLLLDVMAFCVALVTQPGLAQDISGLGFVVAVAAGYGGQGFVRDVQKFVMVVGRRRGN